MLLTGCSDNMFPLYSGSFDIHRGELSTHDLGRLARWISSDIMVRVATNVLTSESETKKLQSENHACADDLNFAILMRWKARTRDGLSIDMLKGVLEEDGSHVNDNEYEEVCLEMR